MLSTLLNVTGLLIGLTAQEHISSASPIIVLRSRALCIAISNAREDESFADDLNKKRGIVNSRVALLLRSIEIQPAVSKIRALSAHHPPSLLSKHNTQPKHPLNSFLSCSTRTPRHEKNASQHSSSASRIKKVRSVMGCTSHQQEVAVRGDGRGEAGAA